MTDERDLPDREGGKGEMTTMEHKEKENSQQSQRNIPLQPRLQLNLDIQIQPQLQPHRLGLRQAGNNRRPSQPTGRQLLVVVAAAAAAASGVDRRDVRRRVIELCSGRQRLVEWVHKRGRGDILFSEVSCQRAKKWAIKVK